MVGGIAQETDDCQIKLDNPEILIKGNSATNNYGTGNGGGIFIKKGILYINSCTIEGNTASNNGGFAYILEGYIYMNGGSILSSFATNGGAIYMENGKFNMSSGSITNNTVTNKGRSNTCKDR